MSAPSISILTEAVPSNPHRAIAGRLLDYVELTKPRISLMSVATVAAGYWVSQSGQPELTRLAYLILGAWLVAASASAFNQLLERDRDALMDRTKSRPIASRRISPYEASILVALWGALGVAILLNLVGQSPAVWAVATWVTYGIAYTPSKLYSRWNTAIGAVSGAMPVLIGASAASDGVTARSMAMAGILFAWQFPHFMAIAWLLRRQYTRAGYVMETTIDPTGKSAGALALAGAIFLVPLIYIAFEPANRAPSAWWILAIGMTTMVSVWLIQATWAFARAPSDSAARHLMRVSLVQLPITLVLVSSCS